MAVLRPSPFAALARRLFRELREKNAAFDLPARRFVRGEADLDLSVTVAGRRMAAPFGPAAGPHTQLARNIVLSWLAGGRAIELKTVQVDDALTLPRPCIDMREVGYNCEYSQELRVDQSLAEYVKGALLVAMLAASGEAGVLPSFTDTVFDASVGYDLAGIRSAKVDGYLRALRDVRPVADRLRAGLPPELRALGEAELPAALVETVTLSTFHGCPPREIEAIAEHLMTRHGVSVVVKLNPTLLGERDVRGLLHEALGFTDIVIPDAAFARDPGLGEAAAMIGRLSARAAALGLRFGVKLTNTLVVENRRPFFPAGVAESYLSGPPLHVIAMHLVERLRRAVGMAVPVSFSAGIDAHNVASAIALDLVPVTVCTDWLKTGGYQRGIRSHEALVERVRRAGARTRAAFVVRALGHEEAALAAAGVTGEAAGRALARLMNTGCLDGEGPRPGAEGPLPGGERAAPPQGATPPEGAAPRPAPGGGSSTDEALPPEVVARWVREAARLNTAEYVAGLAADPRYHRGHHEKAPRKVGSALATFDCLTCDKCVAVCPNDALFTFVAPHLEVARAVARRGEGGVVEERTGVIRIDERHQIALFADDCNDCGNCDAFCPEDGGPFLAKPRFFGSLAALREDPHGEGIFAVRTPGGYRAHVRAGGREVVVEGEGGRVRFSGPGFSLAFDPLDPGGAIEGDVEGAGEVDLTLARVTHVIVTSVLSPREVNPVSSMEEGR